MREQSRGGERVELAVTGMSCAGCAANVERALKGLEGVREANVNLATAKATVLIDPGLVSRADIVRAIRDAGYGVAVSAEAAGADADKEYRSLRTSVIWGGALAL
ncbi:MAG: cation transporter, partial [Candidatus Aminicenantales bacterium]